MGASRSSTPQVGEEVRRIQLDHDELPHVDVQIRRSRRSRHVRLQVDESGVVRASVPLRYASRRLDEVVRERTIWLHEALTKVRHAARTVEVDLHRGDPVRLHGTWHPTRVVAASGRRSRVQMESGTIEISVADSADAHDVLRDWYRSVARQVCIERTEHWAAQAGLRYGRISIRDQRTRWGSCTHRGDLSFNWRLVLAPLWVLDAIVVHELCHIQELNHSDTFWALVDERYPRHREASTWLRQHGSALRVTRPEHDHRSVEDASLGAATASDTQPTLF